MTEPDDCLQKPRSLDSIQLLIKAQDGSSLPFRVKRTTTFRMMFQAYANKRSRDIGTLRFLFDGQRLMPTDTPETRDLEGGDEIDVMIEQVGD